MKFKITKNNIYYLTAVVVLVCALTTFGGWVENIYDGNVATISGK